MESELLERGALATNREPRRNTYPWLMALACPFLLALVMGACGSKDERTLEERAQSIDRSLICPVCPSETLDQSQVELAQQMRVLIREKLAEGWTREEIQGFFVDRYGERVLAAPPKSGFNLLAWIVPPVGGAGAGLLLVFVVRSMRKGREVAHEEVPASAEELEPYLAMVDKQMGLPPESPVESDDRG